MPMKLLKSVGIVFVFFFLSQICKADSQFANNCLDNVIQSINSLANGKISEYEIDENKKFSEYSYTNELVNFFGLDNHFQGINLTPDKNYILLTGSDRWRAKGQLFVLKTSSNKGNDNIVSNSENKVLNILDNFSDNTGWHLGSMALLDQFLILPLEKTDGSSRIFFYKIQDPIHPQKMPLEVLSDFKGGAVAIERNKDGKYILFKYASKNSEIFISKTLNIEDGFENHVYSHYNKNLISTNLKGEAFQLIKQCDGKLFLAAMYNDGLLPPLINGSDKIVLFEVLKNLENKLDQFELLNISETHISCNGLCNFSGATGLSIFAENKIKLVGTKFYRDLDKQKIQVIEIIGR